MWPQNLKPSLIALKITGLSVQCGMADKYKWLSMALCAIILTGTSLTLVPGLCGTLTENVSLDELTTIVYLLQDVKAIVFYAVVVLLAVGQRQSFTRLCQTIGDSKAFQFVDRRVQSIQVLYCAVSLLMVLYTVAAAMTLDVDYFDMLLANGSECLGGLMDDARAGRVNIATDVVANMAVFTTLCYCSLLLGILLSAKRAFSDFNARFAGHNFHNYERPKERYVFVEYTKEHFGLCEIVEDIDKYTNKTFLVIFSLEVPYMVALTFNLLSSRDIYDGPKTVQLAMSFIKVLPLVLAASLLNEEVPVFLNAMARKRPVVSSNAELDNVVTGYFARMSNTHWAITCANIFPITKSVVLTLTSMIVTYVTLLWQMK